ncbi:hypothetical protein LTR15_012827 [Elasticomyces elasticus]|nr:hypothetical protein LTR15_012827 [Elasticomyces elasticus]
MLESALSRQLPYICPKRHALDEWRPPPRIVPPPALTQEDRNRNARQTRIQDEIARQEAIAFANNAESAPPTAPTAFRREDYRQGSANQALKRAMLIRERAPSADERRTLGGRQSKFGGETEVDNTLYTAGALREPWHAILIRLHHVDCSATNNRTLDKTFRYYIWCLPDDTVADLGLLWHRIYYAKDITDITERRPYFAVDTGQLWWWGTLKKAHLVNGSTITHRKANATA